jgi:hypothetical protein
MGDKAVDAKNERTGNQFLNVEQTSRTASRRKLIVSLDGIRRYGRRSVGVFDEDDVG